MERKMRGRGMAASWYGIARTATIDRAGAWAELDDGGTAKIVTGVTEIGEGILTRAGPGGGRGDGGHAARTLPSATTTRPARRRQPMPAPHARPT